MGRSSYTQNMLIGSAIAATIVAASQLLLSQNGRRWLAITALVIAGLGMTVLPRVIRLIVQYRSRKQPEETRPNARDRGE
jgi:hypothetical protein